jgi:hypothetical protein
MQHQFYMEPLLSYIYVQVLCDVKPEKNVQL